MKAGKKKLTLLVDADVRQRAKDLKINISELTERILQSFVAEAGNLPKAEERQGYLGLFAAMDPVLKAHGLQVPVGKAYQNLGDNYEGGETELYYAGNGKFTLEDPGMVGLNLSPEGDELTLEELESGGVDPAFESPTRVITNLIERLNQKKLRREATMNELRIARNVLEAVLAPKSETPTPLPGSSPTEARKPPDPRPRRKQKP